MDQNTIMQATQIQQQHEQLTQHLTIVNQQIDELGMFSKQLTSLKDSKDKELLATIGKGIYMKTKVLEEKMFVEVGSNVLVRKTPEQTQETIKGQLRRLLEIKLQISAQIEQHQAQLQHIIEQLQEQDQQEKK